MIPIFWVIISLLMGYCIVRVGFLRCCVNRVCVVEMTKKIAIFSPFFGIGEKILIGAANYLREKKGWELQAYNLEDSSNFQSRDFSKFSAAIVVDASDQFPAFLENLPIPALTVFCQSRRFDGPFVGVDHGEIGRLAAQHLEGRGFKNYAYVGGTQNPCANERFKAFRDYLDESGGTLHLFSEAFPDFQNTMRDPQDLTDFRERLQTWVETLPKPIGVFALDDWKAFELQLVARNLGIRIPEGIAIVGVNDDDLACQLASTSLTSIRLPLEKMGMEAAKAAVALVEEGLATELMLKPIGLVVRNSTNTFAVNDTVVEEALKFMQQEANKPIRVEEVLKHVGVSRSLLERRFRGEIGRTPLVEMRRQRVERARGLLADTELAVNKIAEMCGFASNIRFTTVFREQVGLTPTEFRAQMQQIG
jgi:LacI family transcriptional regulator